ncbi:methyl-accepting chemotaxis protein, partial [Photobacterium sp. BZF1]|nr:methyl-accepting chemotaxis protein [Photobacterium sp. BZF1]
MKTTKQTSVIRRMYSGIGVMVILFVATLVMMLDGTNRIHQQLQIVTNQSLPLVSLSNQVSVRLLAADKIYKDFLTSQDLERMDVYEDNFGHAHQQFLTAFEQLVNASQDNAALSGQLEALIALENRYFQEARTAMDNYRAQLLAQADRQQSARRFQQLHSSLSSRMKDYVDDHESISVKMIAKNYFVKLQETEVVTSDALATENITVIDDAI